MISTSTRKQQTFVVFKKLMMAASFIFGLFSVAKAQTVYAVTSTNTLISFSATAPNTILSSVPLSGMVAGHTLEGLDFRPATGQLYALSYNTTNGEAQVYRLKVGTGMLSAVRSNPITLATGMSSIGFDFNPMADRIRVTSSTRQNYRLHPDSGTLVITDGTLTYAAGDANASATPNIRATAYSNSLAGATSTAIYYYDFNLNILATSTAPNAGTMNTVGASGISASSAAGVDIDVLSNATTGSNSGYMVAAPSGTNSSFYTLNLSTGSATIVGAIGSGVNVVEMAVGVNQVAANKLVYALSNNNLVSFYSNTPATIVSTVALSGITSGQTVVGMDFRPATGQLFAMGYMSSGSTELYSINLTTGVATSAGAPVMLAANMENIGFDFNPTVDRIRVTSKGRNNYRLNPNDGTISATDGTLTYMAGDANAAATPAITTAAYTNSYAGTTTTAIYYYDVNLNILATSGAPNAGTMNTVGASGITANMNTEQDLDISSNQGAATNQAYLLASTNGTSSNFYNVNLTTGASSLIGTIGTGSLVTEMAIYIVPPAPVKNVYAIQNNNLINFSSSAPGTIISSVPVTGITVGQTIVGLDFRPAMGTLMAMGYVSATGSTQLYNVNMTTGVATSAGPAVMLAANMTGIGFDFNPTVDRIRVVSNTRKNYRLNPNDGTISAMDVDLTYAATDVNASTFPNVYATAYTNSVAGATTTSIYYYDFTLDNLATSAAPNGGVLTTVGRSEISTSTTAGLDLDIITEQSTGVNSAFFSASTNSNSSNFYSVNLATGETMFMGTIGGNMPIMVMAVSNINVTLPVTVTNFTIEKIGKTSQLNWITQSEINNDYFVIERSTDGVRFLPLSAKISSKANAGNSSSRLTYEFVDAIPVKGINYYRLVQSDKDGSTKYSKTLQLQFDELASVRVFPNPTRGIVNISANLTSKTTLSVRVIDALGRNLRSYQYAASEGLFNSRIDLSALRNGMYYVIVNGNNKLLFKQAVQKQ